MDELKGEYAPVLAITHGLETGDSELLRFWSTQIMNAVKYRKDEIPKIPDYEKLPKPYQEFQKFLDKILKELGGTKIIFMIDEYDMIDDLIQKGEIREEFFHLLEWMIKQDRVELVMAGRSPMGNLKTEGWERIARPFAEIKLPPLGKEDAEKLIKNPVKDYIMYDDSAIEKIFGLTNCYPYLIQSCCHVLVTYHNLKRKNALVYADVEGCIPEIIELGKYGLEAMILTDTTPEEQIVLRVMAAVLGEQNSISEQELVVRIRELNKQINVEDIKKAIWHLDDKEVIKLMTEEMRRFKFVCELYRYWIVANMEPLEKRTSAYKL
jgi:predicted CopG family antitoxin